MIDNLIAYTVEHPWHVGIDLSLACGILRALWLLRKVWTEPSERELWERFARGEWQ